MAATTTLGRVWVMQRFSVQCGSVALWPCGPVALWLCGQSSPPPAIAALLAHIARRTAGKKLGRPLQALAY
jgi:hypothetical protein